MYYTLSNIGISWPGALPRFVGLAITKAEFAVTDTYSSRQTSRMEGGRRECIGLVHLVFETVLGLFSIVRSILDLRI